VPAAPPAPRPDHYGLVYSHRPARLHAPMQPLCHPDARTVAAVLQPPDPPRRPMRGRSPPPVLCRMVTRSQIGYIHPVTG
jgi:hypothetical protein